MAGKLPLGNLAIHTKQQDPLCALASGAASGAGAGRIEGREDTSIMPLQDRGSPQSPQIVGGSFGGNEHFEASVGYLA